MNGMNKAIVGIVFGIALIYSALSLGLTVMELLENGTVSMFLFMPHGGELGIDLGEYIGFLTGLYDDFLTTISDMVVTGETGKYVKLALVVIGFLLAAAGFAMRPTLDVQGGDNPAQYLWTHRPKALARCLAAPWGLITGMYSKHKALVIVPIVLLPLYVWWSIPMTLFLIVPFILMKGIVSMKIRSSARKEEKAYVQSTQFAVCPKCKRNFLRPKIKCRCGLELEYPVPNVYGYKYHTCNKGHDIPCTSGDRGNLRTICPYCGADIETREAMPISIAMVGAVGSGKTTMMLAAVKSISQMARTKDITVEAVTPGISKNAVMAKDVVAKSAPGELDSECMFIRSRTIQDREIIINDISGQEFEPKEGKILFEEYFTYSDGIVFAFDPLSLTRQGRTSTPMEVFESFHYMFTQINGVSPSKVSSIPFAVVATKSDISRLGDGDVRSFLIKNGQEGFVKVLESLFKTVSYFSVVSTGDECLSAAKPFWWIVGNSDPELAKAVPI